MFINPNLLNIALIHAKSTGLSLDMNRSNSNVISEAIPLNINWTLTSLGRKYQLVALQKDN